VDYDFVGTHSMPVWKVIGGTNRGGIIVRTGSELTSPLCTDRLSRGALVQQVTLSGDRLKYSLLEGTGPSEGWVSLHVAGKELLVLQDESTVMEETSNVAQPQLKQLFGPVASKNSIDTITIPAGTAVRVVTISDIHVDYAVNRRWFDKHLPTSTPGLYNVMIVPGDVSDDPVKLQATLQMFAHSFQLVCFTPGNHDIWVSRRGSPPDSMKKLRDVLQICEDCGVRTTPVRLKHEGDDPDVLLVPLLAFYSSDWDCEPDLPWAPPESANLASWMDFRAIKWPREMIDEVCRMSGSFEFGNGVTSSGISELFAAQNEGLLKEIISMKAEVPSFVISFSHYVPRQELFPEKRFLWDGHLHKVSGSHALERQIRRLQPDLHIFGHTHLTVDTVLGGIRYIQWALGDPTEQRAMTRAVSETGMLVLYDSSGAEPHICPVQDTFWGTFFTKGLRNPLETCPAPWVRRLYSRIHPHAKLPFDDEYFAHTPHPGPPADSYEGLFDMRWRQ